MPGWAATLNAALSLQPGIRRAVVISGTSPIDRVWLATARQQLAPHQDRLQITYLTDLPMAGVLTRVAALGPDNIVVMGTFLQDGAGQTFVSREATGRVAAASSVPVYGVSETQLGVGTRFVLTVPAVEKAACSFT